VGALSGTAKLAPIIYYQVRLALLLHSDVMQFNSCAEEIGRIKMTEREAIERALQTEKRMLQRQKLLKRLWRLNKQRREAPTENGEPSSTASAKELGRGDSESAALATATVVA
jgi:hypothetical protein